ncbi:MAG: hypothetical protein ACTHU0_07315 [Kofleriaceae bacterium]
MSEARGAREVQAAIEQLDAGGLVPVGARLEGREVLDTVVARAFGHRVLPGRVVVRLSAESLAAGDELEMATLGFEPGEARGAVAQERRRPLGFPGWALVHDPKNARYALEVVKQLQLAARKAGTKPGHARDGFEAIARQLGQRAPQFLPSFYEEAGRAFLAHGAPKHAAEMFGKAREAEAVHALRVDEQHRVAAFLEFALAGAVTTKALTQYAKDLASSHDPRTAYQHFRQLCIQRTLGGMPPWPGMTKELRRLARAAGLEIDAEDAATIAEIIEAPALARAGRELWREYEAPIRSLAAGSPRVRRALLELFPSGGTDPRGLDEVWLDLLESTGALRALTSDDEPGEPRPAGWRAAWFDKLIQHLSRDWRSKHLPARAYALLRAMAPPLIRDGAPIHAIGRWLTIDLDLVELALELGVPVAPTEGARVDLGRWAESAGEPEHGRDPVRAAADPVIGPLIAAAVAGAIGGESFDAAARGKRGFLAAKRAWLVGLIESAEQGALPALEALLSVVSAKVQAETFAELPELHARFAALDPADGLARTLGIGLIDELGWPALEDAARELDPHGTAAPTVHGGPPALVVASSTRAIAVGPAGRLAAFDLVIPPKHELQALRYIGGELLAVWRQGYRAAAAWSRAPRELFEVELDALHAMQIAPRAAVLPGGAWIEHDAPIHPGARAISLGTGLAACDGTTAWISEWKDGGYSWRELSATGERGRLSRPAFLDRDLEPGWRIEPASYVLPAPAASSPLGVADGLVGVRVRERVDPPERWVDTIDGLSWRAPAGARATALVRWPGADAPRPLLEETIWPRGIATAILDPSGAIIGSVMADNDRRYSRGQVAALPPTLWHAMVVRDEAGSRLLRAMDVHGARALIDAIAGDPAASAPIASEIPAACVLPGGALPAIAEPRLRAGIAGAVVVAARLQRAHAELVVERAPDRAVVREAPAADDDVLVPALNGWTHRQWSSGGTSAWAQIERTGALFASDDRMDRELGLLPPSGLDWLDFAVLRGALVFVATAFGTTAPQRAGVAALLAHLDRSLPPPERLRVYDARLAEARHGDYGLVLRWHAGNAYAIRRPGHRWDGVRVLEYAPTGRFIVPPGLMPGEQIDGAPGPSREQIAALADVVAQGRTSWSLDGAARLAAATGLTAAEAVYVLAGCPSAHDRGAHFLDKALREQLGLKAAQAAVARDFVNAIPLARRLRVIEGAGSAGVGALLDGGAADVLAASWNRWIGRRVAVPEALITEATRALDEPMKPAAALAMIGDAAAAPALAHDGTWALGGSGEPIRVHRPEPLVGQAAIAEGPVVFDASALHTAAGYLPFLFAELPVGDPLRAQAAVAHRQVLARLAHPALWLAAGQHYFELRERAAFVQLLGAIGGEPLRGFEDESTLGWRVRGAAVVLSGQRLTLALHPATLDAAAVPTVERLAQLVSEWRRSTWQAVRYLRSPGMAAMMARIEDTPVAAGGWEQDPRASAPAVVERAAARLGVSRDAAALYLQFLVLLWPSPRRLQRWNGWTPKQLDAATAELVARDLLMTANRARAGRGHFLPGGWEALRSPHPPIETWKQPLYAVPDARGAMAPPLGRYLALAALHEMFEVAWDRIESGDVPRYEEVAR